MQQVISCSIVLLNDNWIYNLYRVTYTGLPENCMNMTLGENTQEPIKYKFPKQETYICPTEKIPKLLSTVGCQYHKYTYDLFPVFF